MADGILILSKSGQGKTTSLRNFNPEEVMVIQCKKKRLPFPHKNWKKWDKASAKGSIYNVTTFASVRAALKKMDEVGKKVVIIDDLVYLFANKVMADIDITDWGKWTEIAAEFDETIKTIEAMNEDMRVYILTHTDTNDVGEIQMKTAGKLIEKLMTPEGMFTIVFGMEKTDSGSFFITNGTARDPYKSPMNMFKEKKIPNDLQAADNVISEFWSIGNKTTAVKPV